MALFLRNPAESVVTLTLLVIVFLMVEGISKIIFSLTIRESGCFDSFHKTRRGCRAGADRRPTSSIREAASLAAACPRRVGNGLVSSLVMKAG